MKPWLAKIFDIFSGEGGFLGKILDKIKMDPADKRKMEAELQTELWSFMQTQEDQFRNFVLDYEGKATDIPRWVLGIRSTVRPFLTYAFSGLWIGLAVYVFLHSADFTPAQVAQVDQWGDWLFKLVTITLIFWFGEKVVERTGLVDIFKKPKQPK